MCVVEIHEQSSLSCLARFTVKYALALFLNVQPSTPGSKCDKGRGPWQSESKVLCNVTVPANDAQVPKGQGQEMVAAQAKEKHAESHHDIAS